MSIEDEVGSIYRLPSDVLLGLGTYRKTAHEVEIVEMLEIVSVLDSYANVTIIGIIPKDIISNDEIKIIRKRFEIASFSTIISSVSNLRMAAS